MKEWTRRFPNKLKTNKLKKIKKEKEKKISSSNENVDGNYTVVVPENLVTGNFDEEEIPVDYDEEDDDQEFEAQLEDNENDGKGDGKGGIGVFSQTLLPKKVQMSTSQTGVGSDSFFSIFIPRSPPLFNVVDIAYTSVHPSTKPP